MKNLEGMLEFVAVVERGTFTGASRQLGVSVSHISRQIAALETRLATQLFARTTRQMQLTEPGRRLFDACQPLLQDLLRAQERILETQDAIEGPIRISVAGRFAEEQLVPLLTRFCQAHPRVDIDVDFSAHNVDLLAEGFHLAVRMGPLESSSALMATRLCSFPTVVLASPALLATLPTMASPAALPPAFCLTLINREWTFVKGEQRESVKTAGRFKSNTGAVLVKAALDGLGIINVPAYYASASLIGEGRGKRPLLKRLFTDWHSVEQSTFYIVFPAAPHRPLRVRKLIDYLHANANANANALSMSVEDAEIDYAPGRLHALSKPVDFS